MKAWYVYCTIPFVVNPGKATPRYDYSTVLHEEDGWHRSDIPAPGTSTVVFSNNLTSWRIECPRRQTTITSKQ